MLIAVFITEMVILHKYVYLLFFFSLPETENISTPRSASPLVFRSSTPNYDDESNQTSGLDKNDDLQSRESGGKKRKMSTDSNLIQKKHKENKKTKWVWSVEKVEEMLKFLREYKSTCDFHGVDFEGIVVLTVTC